MLTSKRKSRVEVASHLSPLSRPLFMHHPPFDRELVPVPHALINTVSRVEPIGRTSRIKQ